MKKYFILIFLLVSSLSYSSTMRLLTVEELTNLSDVVVVGTIGNSSYSWANQQSQMWTTTPLAITEFVKWGTSPRPRTIPLRHPGGKLPGPESKTWSLLVAGVPSFKVNQKVMVFLDKKGNYYELVGWAQGYFRVQTNSSGQEILTRDFDGVEFVNEIAEPHTDQVTLNKMVSDVRRVQQ